jgi:hypothetical protein
MLLHIQVAPIFSLDVSPRFDLGTSQNISVTLHDYSASLSVSLLSCMFVRIISQSGLYDFGSEFGNHLH